MSLATYAGADVGSALSGGDAGSSSTRLAIIDSDRGFLQVLVRRLEARGWHHRILGSPVPPEAIVPMRLNAVVVDLAALGPEGWFYLERLCSHGWRESSRSGPTSTRRWWAAPRSISLVASSS
jgi:hypothetical protein